MKRSGRLKPYSTKRTSLRQQRDQCVAEVLRRDYGCKAPDRYNCIDKTDCPPHDPFPRECGGHLDVHEIIPKSAWKLGYLEPSNCLAICRIHHGWIDNNPDAAEFVRLHGRSWDRPK